MTVAIHPRFGRVVHYPKVGLACLDCGDVAHEGPCQSHTCGSCGEECETTGCAEHPTSDVVHHVVPRRP